MGKETESQDRLARFRSRLRSTNQIAKKHWWEIADRWWNLTIKGVIGLAAILTFVVVTHLFYEVLFHRLVVIEPISVPQDMQEKSGYTPDVAALHLRDALNRYAVQARTSAEGSGLALHRDLPLDFVLPTVGLSFEAIVAQIRTFFRIERRQNVSGEITRADERLRLRLRKNAVVIHDCPEGTDAKDLEALLVDAAPCIFAATDPYFNAVTESDKNPETASRLAKKIIADRPPSDWNVVWAHNLLGLLLYQKRRLDDHTSGEDAGSAVKEFTSVINYPNFRAIRHDPIFSIAHLNRGLAYEEQGLTDEAIKEFRTAISIDPELGTAHLNLGDVLDQKGDAEAGCEYLEAMAAFHRAVVSNPFSAVAHQRLGVALNNKKKAEEANCALHNKSALKDLFSYDSVIAEYQRAAELDPDDAHIRYDLGLKLLESPEQVDKSIDELRRALKSREVPNDSFDEFKYDLLKALSQALRIKGRNDEAIGLFDRAVGENEALIDEKPNDNAAAYKRQGVDHYLIGDFERAVEAHGNALRIDETYLADKIDRGYARFALANRRAAEEFDRAAEDFDRAAEDFADALRLPWGRANTMTWLYLSREHSRIILGDKYYGNHPDPSRELRSYASKLLDSSRQERPPIIKLFLDDQSPEDVLKNAEGADKCKAYFYVGEWHALRKRPEDAVKSLEQAAESLQQAVECSQFDAVERSAAEAELERISVALNHISALLPGLSR